MTPPGWTRRCRSRAASRYDSGCIDSLAGEIDSALDCLEHAVAGGMTHLEWVEHDSNLDPLRGRPRFQAVIDRLKAAVTTTPGFSPAGTSR